MSQNTYSACLSVFAEEHPQRAVLRFGLKQESKKKKEKLMSEQWGVKVGYGCFCATRCQKNFLRDLLLEGNSWFLRLFVWGGLPHPFLDAWKRWVIDGFALGYSGTVDRMLASN